MKLFGYAYYRISKYYGKYEDRPDLSAITIASGAQAFNLLSLLPLAFHLKQSNWLVLLTILLIDLVNIFYFLPRRKLEIYERK